MKRYWLAIAFIAAVFLASPPVQAASSSLTEKDAPMLSEDRLAGVVKNEHCIIMYYHPDLGSRDEGARDQFEATPQQLADRLMRRMIELADRIQSPVRFYQVNWKGFSEDAIDRIRSDAGTLQKQPESPTIVTYVLNGPIAHRFRGIARPDMMPWFVHDVMDYFIHAIRTDKGEYLRGGWLFTDTNASFISLTAVRQEMREFGGKTETVRVVDYVSRPYEGFACRYERIYSPDNRLLASIEDYGKYGKFGYFDYDRTGKLQYRVKYKQGAQ